MNLFAFLLFAALLLSPGAARATQSGQNSLQNWKVMDVCAKQAQAAYPEYSTASNAKRDAKLKECLNANHLPPRQPLSRP
jgi:hypothetical protein